MRRPEDKAALQAALDAVKGVEACARAAAKFIQDTIDLTASDNDGKTESESRKMNIEQISREINRLSGTCDDGPQIRRLLIEMIAKMDEIEKRLEAADLTARRAAREASCLANGIKPD